MKTFQPTLELRAFYDALVAKANYADAFSEYATAGHRTLPALPSRPADVQQAAFLDHLCMPLYGLLKNAYDRMNAVQNQQAVTTVHAPAGSGLTDLEYLMLMQQQSSGAP